MSSTELLGAAAAAEVLGVSVATVKRLAATNTLRPAHKMPGKTGAYLFRLREVERVAATRSGRAA